MILRRITEFLLNPRVSLQHKLAPVLPILNLQQKLPNQENCLFLPATNLGLAFYHEARRGPKRAGRKTAMVPARRDTTDMAKEFRSWIHRLRPGFSPQDVCTVLEQQTDPDLALDIFHWTALQRPYRHNHQTYESMIKILASSRRFKHMLRLMEDAVAGACTGSQSLFNCIIFQYCKLKMLGPAISVYKKMQSHNLEECRPNLTTYNLLMHALLGRFSNFIVSCVHLRSVRSLYKQMIDAGVVPDVVTLNLMIKAYSRAQEMDSAIRVFREMGVYGCEPSPYSFNYIIRGLCETSRIQEAREFYDMMISRGMFPNRRVYNVFVCSLAMEGRLKEACKVLLEMTDKGLIPDFLTYRTLVDEHCKHGKGNSVVAFLQEVRAMDGFLEEGIYRSLVEKFNLRSYDDSVKALT